MRALIAGLLLFVSALPAYAGVRVEKDAAGHWRLFVDNDEYFVRGMDYRPTRIGESPDEGTLKDWAFYDYDGDWKSDAPYGAWVDANRNERRDPDEPVVGDFALMRDTGVNTIRWYVNDFHEQQAPKGLLRELFAKYGIRVAVGNKFGAYTIDSGAAWHEGTDYRDPDQRKRMLESVRKMVGEHKNEPYLLLWLLGNENNLRFTNTNAGQFPEAYATLLNEAAELIHSLDGKHPVALVNGDTRHLNYYKKHAPAIDIFGVNAYRGSKGFGNLWKEVRHGVDRPVLVTEYGGSYANGADEKGQAEYHEGCWLDIEANRAGGNGLGNSLGGFAFEWLDEWWKSGKPWEQAPRGSIGEQGKTDASWTQEYCGLYGQGNGKSSPFLRRPRKVVDVYKRLWSARPEPPKRRAEVEFLEE